MVRQPSVDRFCGIGRKLFGGIELFMVDSNELLDDPHFAVAEAASSLFRFAELRS